MFKQAQKHLSDISCSELAATPPIFFGAKNKDVCQFFILLICRSGWVLEGGVNAFPLDSKSPWTLKCWQNSTPKIENR